MTAVKVALLCILLALTLLGSFAPSINRFRGIPQSSVEASPSAGFTLTAQPSNVTSDIGDSAIATIFVHSTGYTGKVDLYFTQYSTDYGLSCGSTPNPCSVNVPPDANSTVTCADDEPYATTLTVVARNVNTGVTESISISLNFTSSTQGSSSQLGNNSTTIRSGNTTPLIYIALGAAIIVIAVMASITAYAFRRWKV